MSNADNIGPAARTRNSAGTTSDRRSRFELIDGEDKSTWRLEAEAAASIAAELVRLAGRLPLESELRGGWLDYAGQMRYLAAIRGVHGNERHLALVEA